jgi:hypothetical protein
MTSLAVFACKRDGIGCKALQPIYLVQQSAKHTESLEAKGRRTEPITR